MNLGMSFPRNLLLAFLICSSSQVFAAQRYPASGLVLKVEPAQRTMVVSCQAIPGYMEAMVMSFPVKDASQLRGLTPGAMIEFSLVVGKKDAYAEAVHIRGYESLEQEPLQARRLAILQGLNVGSGAAKPLAVGDSVPDFKLVDQRQRAVSLGDFAGKVVALNFIYTRCPLPNYCFRISNNFGVLQKRFKDKLGHDLVLLTVTFDPLHDKPETMAEYARTWKADPEWWRFLTGPAADVDRVCSLFGVYYWPDEALLTHSLHTAVIDRRGRMIANLDGNQFTPEQLGDLVQSVIERHD